MSHAVKHVFHKVGHVFHKIGHGVEHVFHEVKKHPSLLLAPLGGLGLAEAAGASLPGVLGSVGSAVESIGSAVVKPVGSLLGLSEGASASGLFSSSTIGTIGKIAKVGSLAMMIDSKFNKPKPPSASSFFKDSISTLGSFSPPDIKFDKNLLNAPNPFDFLGLAKPSSNKGNSSGIISKQSVSLFDETRCRGRC